MPIRYNYPVILELFIEQEGVWELAHSSTVYNKVSLYSKFETIKTMYALANKNYEIFITVQSKVNTFVEKKGALKRP